MANANSTDTAPTSILDIALQKAKQNPAQTLIGDAAVVAALEFVCHCSNQAGTRFLLACLLAKLSDANVDIRKPYTEIGGAGIFSGRHYDETYITPFAFRNNLPVNPTSGFLTPAFRTNKTLIEPGVALVGRPQELYLKVVEIITAVHLGKFDAAEVLAEILRWLLIIKQERDERMRTLLSSLKATRRDVALPAEAIITLIQQHLALPKTARLPVLVVAAAYQAAQGYLGEYCLPLHGHNAADKQTGALGDVEIALKNESGVVTAYEMKAKRVTCEDLEVALQKLVNAAPHIENYIFITTDKIDDAVKDLAATTHEKVGVKFVVLDCLGFLRHFLHFFYRIRLQFLEAYQTLVLQEPDSAVNPSLKEAFLALRVATETGIAQTG
jgi:DNA adenine methylase